MLTATLSTKPSLFILVAVELLENAKSPSPSAGSTEYILLALYALGIKANFGFIIIYLL
jgi:hypothetical protein